ncbi:Uma2 family endonuclease [Desulfonatronum lacustre]|uniref:Uma2 family endonuclease n=1 Tax=Desulfonatronum lacustre TaxID=66849 RepID=UPI0004918D3C|nr:Uma2 family endonuclease [Desulfonatronum lacustre]
MTAYPQFQETPYTYRDYLEWPDDQRWELIDGTPQAMTPGPSVTHQQVVLSIAAQVERALSEKECRPFIAPLEVLFPKPIENEDNVRTVLQPDLFVVCDQRKIKSNAVVGAPDWIVEVLSPKTASRDHIAKRRIYEQAGVREYWLVHPEDRVVMIYRLEKEGFGKPDVVPMEGETGVGILPEVVIQWD